MLHSWGLGMRWDGRLLVAPGPFDIYFVPDPQGAPWQSDYTHFVFMKGHLISGPLPGYNAFVNFIKNIDQTQTLIEAP